MHYYHKFLLCINVEKRENRKKKQASANFKKF